MQLLLLSCGRCEQGGPGWTTYILESGAALCHVYISHHLQIREDESVFVREEKRQKEGEREAAHWLVAPCLFKVALRQLGRRVEIVSCVRS